MNWKNTSVKWKPSTSARKRRRLATSSIAPGPGGFASGQSVGGGIEQWANGGRRPLGFEWKKTGGFLRTRGRQRSHRRRAIRVRDGRSEERRVGQQRTGRW